MLIYLSLWCFCRISRSERTGRYGADMRKHDPECYGKRSRDVEKDYDRRWVHDRYKDYCDERRDQDSPEVSGEEFLCGLKYVLIRVILNLLFLKLNITLLYIFFLLQRSRKRRSSSRSDDEYDGEYPEQDYKMEQEEESKTIMLRGLPVHVTEDDVSSQFAIQWHSCFLKEKTHQTVYHITFS